MQISSELSKLIVELSLQLKNKFDIKIGYTHSMGCFLNENDDFIIMVEGDLVITDEDNHILDFENMKSYLVESNTFCEEYHGIGVALKYDVHQTSERISNSL